MSRGERRKLRSRRVAEAYHSEEQQLSARARGHRSLPKATLAHRDMSASRCTSPRMGKNLSEVAGTISTTWGTVQTPHWERRPA